MSYVRHSFILIKDRLGYLLVQSFSSFSVDIVVCVIFTIEVIRASNQGVSRSRLGFSAGVAGVLDDVGLSNRPIWPMCIVSYSIYTLSLA